MKSSLFILLVSLVGVTSTNPFFSCPNATTRALSTVVKVEADSIDSCTDRNMPLVIQEFLSDELAIKAGSTQTLNETIVQFHMCDRSSRSRKLRWLQGGYYLYFGGGSCTSCGGDDGDGRRLLRSLVTLNTDQRIELETVLSTTLTRAAITHFTDNNDIESCLYGDTSLNVIVSLELAVAGSDFCNV